MGLSLLRVRTLDYNYILAFLTPNPRKVITLGILAFLTPNLRKVITLVITQFLPLLKSIELIRKW